MKKRHNIVLVSILFILLGFNISCSDNKDSVAEGNGITEQSWNKNKTYFINAEQTLTFSFTAQSSWTAQSSSAALLSLSTNAGNSGKNTLSVTAHNSSQKQASITIKVNGYSTTNIIKIELTSNEIKDSEINLQVDQYLKTYYLWNDEYRTLTPDFTLAYDDFLEETLMSMQTNILDKKLYHSGNQSYYALFSFIDKLDPNLQSTRATTIEKKKLEYNYGFVNILPVKYSKSQDPTTYVLFAVQGVYPGSSAEQAGIKRGVEITHINGQIITENNWTSYLQSLLIPSSTNTLSVKDYGEKTYSINSGPIYANPVIYHQVKNQIGYLVYSSFQASFDQELFDVFKEFKNQNITNLILDLRYNRGGHVMSANLMASCIAGASSENQTFASYRYNDDRMQALHNIRPIEKFAYSRYENLNNISLSAGALNLKRVYCLVTESSASSSELVINSLKGIGIDVILIGTKTHGKNVGMEGVELTTATAKYELYPITFQTYNAQGFGKYEDGFSPNYAIDEDNPNGPYFEGYYDFGTSNEVLYAKAVSLITGNNVPSQSTVRSSSKIAGKALPKIEVKRIGIIKQEPK